MFIQTRWRKILKDMWSNRSRSMLVVFSIAVGVAAVGMINNAANMIQRDLYREFIKGNPALLQIYVSPFRESLARSVEGMREVEAAEARRVLDASILSPKNHWEDLQMMVVPDFEDVEINHFMVETGSPKPKIREILLERQSAKALRLTVGDEVMVEMPDNRSYALTVAGIVHDVYVMPFSLMGEATGYVSMETLQWLGQEPYYNRLDIVVSQNQYDKTFVLNTGNLVRDRVIEPAGYKVLNVQIPGIGSDPGQHWAQNQMKGFILILQVMGIMAVLLSGGLVINTVSAILTQQIRQIGIMRSIGATRLQVIVLYVANVLVFSVLGLLIAIPMGLLGAWWLTNFAANFLNFNLTHVTLPPDVLLLQIVLGLVMPVGVALGPILAGTRLSVYDAIYQYGLGGEEKHGWMEVVAGKLRRISPALILSLRNTFRKKARLAFTLVTLTLAGAMFISVFSTRSSLTAQINEVGRYIHYDASLSLPGGANLHAVEREALRIPGVTVAEGWAQARGVIVRLDSSESGGIDIIGLPHNPATIRPLLLAGNWIRGNNPRQIVVNADLLDDEPNIHVGSEIVLKVGSVKQIYQVVGVLSKHLSGPRVYMYYNAFGKLTGRYNQVDVVRVLVDPKNLGSAGEQDNIARLLEERFENAQFNPGGSSTNHAFIGRFTDVFDIILIVLVIMAALLAVVGGLGLSGAMGMNILERTREIGVLRAVGASNFTVRKVVVVEGVVVGLISWVMGAFLSGPSGQALASAVINAVLQSKANYRYSFAGLLIWLVIVVLIGVFSSLAPAQRAALLRVREVLDYE